jgi:type II secretory pathway pseudopilin PulG
MTPRHPSQTGISLVEVAIVVSVMAMLTGILAPAGFQLVGQARDVRVLHDCQGIRDALVKMLTDLGKTSLRLAGDTSPRVELLVSDGPVPAAASATETAWTRDVEASGAIDLLDRYLITNDPAGDASRGWLPPVTAGALGWRGAYLRTETDADPWGHRYAVNVRYLGQRPDVLVLSAGPNGIVETPFEGNHLSYGGDDVAILVK